ncbi:hypothetical protein DFP72DRAFT_868144 [Ephemerocybe angulata]|uniref:Uncharacterized protein n=1 Tax=Ephemerocybe angulata TaxID=980116 RepID=A0A8H6IHJ2_9AGAR|nr:hypothetical protein DFP72DRAFT_868144 [Tulosesus angulatus]
MTDRLSDPRRIGWPRLRSPASGAFRLLLTAVLMQGPQRSWTRYFDRAADTPFAYFFAPSLSPEQLAQNPESGCYAAECECRLLQHDDLSCTVLAGPLPVPCGRGCACSKLSLPISVHRISILAPRGAACFSASLPRFPSVTLELAPYLLPLESGV